MKDDSDALNRMAAASLLAEEWSELRAGWGEIERHHRFVALCDELDGLDLAAKSYAEVQRERPGDPLCRQMSAQILWRARMRLERPRSEDPGDRATARLKLAGLVLLLLLLPLLLLRTILGSTQQLGQSTPSATAPAASSGRVPAPR
jgi:hypothetical protein